MTPDLRAAAERALAREKVADAVLHDEEWGVDRSVARTEALAAYRALPPGPGAAALVAEIERLERIVSEAARRDLRALMSETSEDFYSAGWMEDCEYHFWMMANGWGPRRYGIGEVQKETVAGMLELAKKVGGWHTYDEFVPLPEWRTMFAKWWMEFHIPRLALRPDAFRAQIEEEKQPPKGRFAATLRSIRGLTTEEDVFRAEDELAEARALTSQVLAEAGK